jgi:hypothetical protein
MTSTESIGIRIGNRDFARATSLAYQTYLRFQARSGYYNNTPNSHLRGKLGEIACQRWCEFNDIVNEALFEDPEQIGEADLVVRDDADHRIEVKTWDETGWDQWGRCIAVPQLPKLRAKADCVLWCTSPKVLVAGIRVMLVGWNTVDDIAAAPRRWTGPAWGRQVDNYQLDSQTIRPMAALLKELGT